MKKIILPVLMGMSLLLPGISRAQQAPLVSQYMFNTLYINPAYAGYKGDIFAHAFYRSQWIGMTGAPETAALSVDMAVADNRVGLGLVVGNDRYGANHTNSFMTNYSYRFNINRTMQLSFGIAAGLINYGVDGSKLDPIQVGDPLVATSMYNVWLPEAGAGAYLSDDRFYVGFSAVNILSRYMPIRGNELQQYVQRTMPGLMLTAGMMFPLSDQFDFKPSFLLREDFNNPTSVDFNFMFLISKTVWVGTSYRMSAILGKDIDEKSLQSSALALLLEVYATEHLRIGYSYDYDFGEISRYSGGNHEISVGFNISSLSSSRDRRKVQRMRYF